MSRSALSLVVASVLLLGMVGLARADLVLVDLVNTAAQTTPFALPFIAGAVSTAVTFAGFDVPEDFQAEAIQLTLTEGEPTGPNLLGPTWVFTPAPPPGSLAFQFDDGLGTGTNGLFFAGTVEGSFDQFAQTIPTVTGQSYTLSFVFINSTGAVPSELRVTASDALALPAPATLMLFSVGLILVAASALRRRLRHTSR